jgi:hypothetical protein
VKPQISVRIVAARQSAWLQVLAQEPVELQVLAVRELAELQVLAVREPAELQVLAVREPVVPLVSRLLLLVDWEPVASPDAPQVPVAVPPARASFRVFRRAVRSSGRLGVVQQLETAPEYDTQSEAGERQQARPDVPGSRGRIERD